MKRISLIAIGILTATALGGAAFAAGTHGGAGSSANAGMMGEHAGMMQMMQQMHEQMIGSMGAHGMMEGRGPMGGMGEKGMMGGPHSMSAIFLQQFDRDGDGRLTSDEARAGLQDKLTTYDANSDGSLSIEEFEVLHSAMIRESMVDRFQHLDSDGDGKVTPSEIVAPAEQLERMQTMRMRASNGEKMTPGMSRGKSGEREHGSQNLENE